MQFLLTDIGHDLGYDIFVATNDRGKSLSDCHGLCKFGDDYRILFKLAKDASCSSR
jgi:hypothetical protein